MQRTLVLLSLLALALVSCGDEERLVILTASSLTDVTEALAQAAGIDAAVSAAGSQTLAAQVRGGAAADVLLLADRQLAEELHAGGAAGAPVEVAGTSLAIAVRTDRSEAVRGPVDLARSELRVVLADAEVPLGRYTREGYRALEASGVVPVGTLDAVLEGVDSLEDAARSVLSKVSVGEADAAVVFAADRRLAPELAFVAWPEEVRVRYTIQTLEGAGQPELADAFTAFVTGAPAGPVWERFGFDPVP